MVENKIGNIFLKSGKIKQKQLAMALEEQNRIRLSQPLGEVMVRLGFVSSEDVAQILAQQLKISYLELGEDFKIEPEERKLIPEEIARKLCLIPLKKENNIVTVVMKDPLDIEAIDAVRTLTGLEVHKAVSTEERILATINHFYKEEAYIERDLQDIVDLETERVSKDIEEQSVGAEQLRILANDAPVVRFVNLLLLQAVRDRASDIHFEPGEEDITVRLRIDGLLRKVTPPPKTLYQAILTRIKILSNMDIAERRLPQDGRFKFKVKKRTVDVRVSSLPEASGEKLVLRILNRAALILNMEDIGFEADMVSRFQKILKQPHGIILLTGPTGSGKTTALYSALNFLATPDKNIQTVEDPIEYLIKGINQMQVKSQIGLSFANALRSILRQDPDIIMIGEIRDLDTARIAMHAALTGHLVLSTLHTNDAISAFNRLKDIGIEPYLITATVNLVISQRLVRLICPKCRQEITPSAHTLKLIPDAKKGKYYRGKGCEFCFQSGYKGRTGIFEFLEVSEPLKEMVLKGIGEGALRKRAIELGMTTLLSDGLNKVKQGKTTIEEVLSVCPLPEASSR